MTTKVTAPGKKSLQTTLEIGKAIRGHYEGVKAAKAEGKPIIWSFGILPREIYHAAGAPVIYMEHLSLIIAAKQLSGRYMQLAEEEGFSKDSCAAHRCFMGFATTEERDPYAENFFVPPDLILGSNLPCISESKTFLYVVNHYDRPYYFIDAPINSWGKNIPDYAIEYYKSQLQGALDFMEEYGYKVDEDKLKETVRLSKRSIELWNEIEQLRKTVPSPMGLADGLTAAYPLIQLQGTQLGVTLYERLLAELKEKVEKKKGIIDDEKLRLMYFGVPPVYNLGIFDYVEKYGAVVIKSVIECFMNNMQGDLYDPSIIDPERPLESLAYKALVDMLNPTSQNMVDFVVKGVEDFKIDGLIAGVKRTCGLMPGYMRLAKDAVYEKAGIPTTIFDLDGIDIREYDDVNTKANLDSFIESLLANKRR